MRVRDHLKEICRHSKPAAAAAATQTSIILQVVKGGMLDGLLGFLLSLSALVPPSVFPPWQGTIEHEGRCN